MKNRRNPGMVYGILGGVIVLLVAAVAVLATTLYNDRNRASADGSGTQAAGTSAPEKETEEETEGGGMYAEYTEPTETPVDIYYVENNFDAEACDIKPTVSEEGWYIENVGCLEGCPWACMYSDEKGVYDEGRIRAFENAIFEKIRYFSDSYEDISSVSRITIDTRTVPDEKNPNRYIVLSFNTQDNEGILMCDLGDVIGAASTCISEKPTILINEGKDYIRNLGILVDVENGWSDDMITRMQKSLFEILNERGLHPGMMVINQGLVEYDNETNEYSIMIQQYSNEDYLIDIDYNADTDKFKIVLLGVEEANEKK